MEKVVAKPVVWNHSTEQVASQASTKVVERELELSPDDILLPSNSLKSNHLEFIRVSIIFSSSYDHHILAGEEKVVTTTFSFLSLSSWAQPNFEQESNAALGWLDI